MNLKKHIPNAITCGNLLCGCLAIVNVFEGNFLWTAYFIGIALILDFFDGFTARMLKVSSAIGKDLDSLADMVTFGVVPGLIMFHLIQDKIVGNELHFILPYVALLIPIFSAIRLAKFNNDTRQSDSFIGLPTPANAMFIAVLPFMSKYEFSFFSMNSFINNPYVLATLSVILSFLLVAEIKLIALKFKNFSWKENKLRFILLLTSLLLLIVFKLLGVLLIIIFYILLSLIGSWVRKNVSNK